MALNVEKNDFFVRMASRRSTRAFRVALATGERAARLREHYGRLFDEEIAAHARKAEDPDVEIPVPDSDFPVRKRYPDEV